MRIAVTGGSGRVGAAVVRELVDRGHSVVNLDLRQAQEPIARFVYLDLRQREILQPVLEQMDVVIHLGELPGVNGRSHQEVYTTNTAIGAAVLQTAADLKLRRVIYTSTCQVYGTWGGANLPPVTLPMDESHPLRPQNGYALSKVANEAFSRLMSEQTGLRVSAFRLPWVFLDVEPDRIYRWLSRPRRGPSLEMGTYVHTSDVARAYVAAIEADLDGWRVYHLSADDVALSSPLPTMLRDLLPEYPPLPADWGDFASPLITARARDELGWVPQWSIREAYPPLVGELSEPAAHAVGK